MAIDTYGDLAQVEPDAAAASRADATRLTLLGELERRNPTDVDSLMNLADGYSDAGIFRAERNALDGARRYYGDAVRIYEAIVARGVPRARWVRPYTLALKRLGAVEMVTDALAGQRAALPSGPRVGDGAAACRPRQPPVAVRTDLHAVRPRTAGTASGPPRRGHPAVDRSARRPRPGARRAIPGTRGGSTRWRRSRSGSGAPTSTAAPMRRRRRASARKWRCASVWSSRSPASDRGSWTWRGRG